MKKLAFTALFIASVFLLGACSSKEEVVVKTSTGEITKEEFYNELKDRYGEAVLREMVTLSILNDKYEVDENEVDERIAEVKEQLGDQFEMLIQQQGIQDEDELKRFMKANLLQEAAVTEGLEVSEDEIKAQYDKEITEIDAQHIVVEDEEDAVKIKKELDEGADFAKLAKKHSTDEANKNDGGNLGYFGYGEMVGEFFEAAYELEKDTISEPVQTSYGFHIIKVNDKREKEDIESFEDRKEAIERELLNSKIDPTEAQEKLNKIIKDAKIDVKIKEYENLFDIAE